ncbi:MAG: glycosyltransferase family 1 protein [Desulfobacterales bacterium]
MRIGIDTYQAGFPFGGISRYVRSLISAMVAAGPADRFVLVNNHFRRTHRPWHFSESNVEHFNLRAPRRIIQAFWSRIGWPPIDAFVGPLDVFHGTHMILPAMRSGKLVLTLHDLIFLKHPDYFSDRKLNVWAHRVELPVAIKRADLIVTPSDYSRRALIELMKVPEDKIRVVYEGVEPHFFVPEDSLELQTVLNRLGLTEPYKVFLVGTPEPRKNLIRTVAAARQAAPDLQLVIVGPREPITQLLNGDTGGLNLIGSVAEEDLPYVLNGALLSLDPSLAEGFGLPAVEALAAGVPLVTSNRTALPEVVGNAAVMVDPESVEEIAAAARNLLSDEQRRSQLIESGKIRARELSWDQSARQMLSIYRELVS